MRRSMRVVVTAVLVASATSIALAAAAVIAKPKKTPALVERGRALFATNCVPCHGDKGEGNGPAAAALKPPPRNFVTEPFKQGDKVEDIFATLGKGVPGSGMAAYGSLPEEDRWALAYFVSSLRSGGKAGKK